MGGVLPGSASAVDDMPEQHGILGSDELRPGYCGPPALIECASEILAVGHLKFLGHLPQGGAAYDDRVRQTANG